MTSRTLDKVDYAIGLVIMLILSGTAFVLHTEYRESKILMVHLVRSDWKCDATSDGPDGFLCTRWVRKDPAKK